MKDNILRMEGVKGGDETGRPPAPPAGETRESAQKKLDYATPDRKASPPPPAKSKGKSKGTIKTATAARKTGVKGKDDADDTEFAAGVDEEAAKSDTEEQSI
jgi:hypothetical protein